MKRKTGIHLAPACLLLTVSLSTSSPAAPAAGAVTQSSPPDSSSLQTTEPAPVHYFYEPFPLEPGSDVFQIGASFSLRPYPDMEQELPIPALDVQYKRGISANAAIVGNLSTNIYSNLLHAGIQLHVGHGRLSCGLADHIGGVYSFIKREQVFDKVYAYAVFDMLILRLGYRFDDFAFSLSLVATYVIKSGSQVNDMKIPGGPEGSVNDYWCTWAIEQPFLKNLRLSVGMSLGYTRTPYQTWMLYNTTDEWLFAPEFFFAVQL